MQLTVPALRPRRCVSVFYVCVSKGGTEVIFRRRQERVLSLRGEAKKSLLSQSGREEIFVAGRKSLSQGGREERKSLSQSGGEEIFVAERRSGNRCRRAEEKKSLSQGGREESAS